MSWYSLPAMRHRGCGIVPEVRQCFQRVTKLIVSGTGLESRAIERNSRVCENDQSLERLPSIAGSGKARVNPRGPPRKAKYKLATDSARVP